MLRIKGPVSMPARSTTVAVLGCVSLVSGVAACSADVTRFDRSLLETSSTGSTHSSTNNAPMTLSAQSPGDTYSGVRFSEQRDPVSRRSLAPTPVASTPAKLPPVSTINASPSRTTTASGTSRPIKVADASPYTGGATLNDGSYGRDTITVERGDTLYGLARRHRVSVSALKSTNGLTTNVIRPGQTLALPASDAATGSSRPVLPPQTRPVTATAPADGTYIVQPGDSLYRISRQTGVSVADLQSFNSVGDVRRLMPGQVLNLGPSAQPSSDAPRVARRQPVEPRRDVSPRRVDTRVINRPSPSSNRTLTDANRAAPRVGERSARLTDASAKGSSSKFEWPARGSIISRFGPRRDGSHNDGVDIALPLGTEIRAAGDGIVAYADDELKAYGNLVLIRHDNGWVSAYAHAKSLNVKRGDEVRRGQVIARVGQTGSVTKPTLHFELRDGSKPVNPLPYLPR